MPIFRPDEYRHQNSNMAVVDSESLRGGRRVVADLTALYALASKVDQLKQYVSIVRVLNDGSGKANDYLLIDITEVGSAAGWQKLRGGVDLSEAQPGQLIVVGPENETQFKFPQELATSPPISVTYSQLRTLMLTNSLIVGIYYRITDFQTRHIIPNSTHLNVNGTVYPDKANFLNNGSEGVEEIVVLAVANNTLAPEAASLLFPLDILRYDATDSFCEDMQTPRPGRIVYRESTTQSISAYYDWRTVKFIRYRTNHPEYNPATVYAKNAVTRVGTALYVSTVNNNVGVAPTHDNANQNWVWLYDFASARQQIREYICVSGTTTQLLTSTSFVQANPNDYRYFYTFNRVTNVTTQETAQYVVPGKVYNVHIGDAGKLNNIVFVGDAALDTYFRHIQLGGLNQNMTFLREVEYLRTGGDCQSNIFRDAVRAVTTGNWFSFNVFTNGTVEALTCGSGFVYNCFKTVTRSFFGETYQGNLHKYNVLNSFFAPISSGNLFHGDVSQVNFVQRAVNCIFKANVSDSVFLERMNAVTFEGAISFVKFLRGQLNGTIPALSSTEWPIFRTRVEQGETVVTPAVLMHDVATPSDFLTLTDTGNDVVITGFAGGWPGRKLTVFNASTMYLTVKEGSADSLAANRIQPSDLSESGTYEQVIPGYSVALYTYSGHLGRWVLSAVFKAPAVTSAQPAEDANYLELAVAANLTIPTDRKHKTLYTNITTSQNIDSISLSGLTSGKTVDWYIKNNSGAGRTIVLPAGVMLDMGSKQQNGYYNSSTRTLTLDNTHELKIYFEHNNLGIRCFFTKIVEA